MRKRWVAVVAAVSLSAGFVLGAVFGGALGIGLLAAAAGPAVKPTGDPPTGLTVASTSPARVDPGATFEITLTITNDLDQPRFLGDIDIESRLLAGIRIESVDPSPKSTSALSMYRVYRMGQTIPAKGALTITFRCVAQTEGQHRGHIDVYVDSDTAYTTRVIEVNVAPASEP